MKVLVVEDDKIAQIGIKKILGTLDLDLELMMAENGQEGLDYFDKSEAEGTAFVLLDLNMPVMNGFEFLEGVRKSDTLKDLPVIVHTTSDNEEDLKNAELLGSQVILSKISITGSTKKHFSTYHTTGIIQNKKEYFERIYFHLSARFYRRNI